MSPSAHNESYHHGDAHAALLDAALRLIETTGAQGLSLRQVAHEAGLSRQAPYNHFADKEALLAEVVAEGFRRLEMRLHAAQGYPDGPLALEGAFNAYVECAQAAPALFRLMFSRELVRLDRFPEAQQQGAAAFAALVAVVAAFTAPEDTDEISLLAWVTAHGYATLALEVGFPDDPATRHARSHRYAAMLRREAVQPAAGASQ